MKLPIAPQTYQPASGVLVRAVKRAALILGRCAGEETQLEHGTCIHQPGKAAHPLTHFAADVSVPSGQAAGDAVAAVLQHFSQAGSRCRQWDAVEETWPAELAQALEAAGFRRRPWDLWLLHGYQPPAPTAAKLQIIPARAAYSEFRKLVQAAAAEPTAGSGDAAAATEVEARLAHLDEPRLEMLLARQDRQPVAAAGVLSLGDMGVLYDLLLHPQADAASVVPVLMAQVLDHCQRALFEQVLATQLADSPQADWLRALHFKVGATYDRFVA